MRRTAMALTLHLPPELEQRLTEEARQQGVSADVYTVRILEQHFPPKNGQSELVRLLQSWIDADGADAHEQVETGEYLIQSLDEDRLSDRKLFPAELEGITW
jgi:predicted DNA-binding protein